MVSGLLVLTLNLTCKGFVMDVVGIEIVREREGSSDGRTIVPAGIDHEMAAARVLGL